MNTERDGRICQLFLDGTTQPDLANRFHLTLARIGQILRKAGLVKEDYPTVPVTRRASFTGVNLADLVKDAVRREAKREEKSISQFISDLVTKEMQARGIDTEIKTFLAEEDVRLPLEDA